MIPALGAYYRPQRLDEALQLLQAEPNARILAGGTDLLLEANPVHAVVDITHLGLDRIDANDGDLILGAGVRVEDIMHAETTRTWADGVLVGGALNFGTLQVRNMATLGGNIAHALPAADLVPALMALDAEVRLARAVPGSGAAMPQQVTHRSLTLEGFVTAPFQTQLQAGELLVDVRIPAATRRWRAQFRKIGRVLKDLAQVNCAVALDLEDGHVQQARIVVGAVHPVVTRVHAAEAHITGAEPRSGDWAERCARAVEAVRSFIQPITDVRASAAWRRHVCGVLVRRSLDYAADPRHAGQVPCYEDGPLYCSGLESGGTP